MMPPLSPNQSNPQPQGPTVLQYPSATGVGRGWTRQQVALGMLIGWVTMLPGLPLYLWWAHRSLAPTTGWTVPLSAYAAGVLGMLLAASSVRRAHQMPGLLPGLSVGLAAGLLAIGAFVRVYT